MARRRYEMRKRAQGAEETRRRLVEATFQLHGEQGIATTTMKQIAERAGVSIGTAYHHFPTYDDAIMACGAHVTSLYRPPGEEIFAPGMTIAERIATLARAMFGFYDRQIGLEVARRDATRFAVLQGFLDAEEEHRRTLSARALRPEIDEPRVSDALAALLDIAVLRGLQAAGYTVDGAAETLADIALSWITQRVPAGSTAAPLQQEDRNADQGR